MLPESISRKILIPLWEGGVKRRPIFKYLEQCENNRAILLPEFESRRLAKLQSLLLHCQQNVPFYRELWSEIGFDYRDLTEISQIRQLPVLSKELISENYNRLISLKHRGNNIRKKTGGSTGVPFAFEHCKGSYAWRQAVTWRGYAECGVRPGRKTLYLWGADLGKANLMKRFIDHIYHAIYNRHMLNSFVMSQKNMPEYLAAIKSVRPEAIVSYVSPIFTLAEYMLENNLQIKGPELVLTGAEPLYDFQKNIISKAFGCPVYNTYGCREFMLMAWESPADNQLRWAADQFLLESVDNHNEPIAGKSGDLLVTDFNNYGMPFIRYKNGDRITLESDPYVLQEHFPIVKSVDGRKLDIIRGFEGVQLPGEFFPHLLKELRSIKRFQAVQKVVGQVTLKIVPSSNLTDEDKKFIHNEVERVCGRNLACTIEIVDDIPLTASGKYRVAISELGGDS